MKLKTIVALGAGLLGTSQAFAVTVDIDFEAFNGQYATQIGEFYSSQGASFSSNALSLSNDDGTGIPYYPNAPGIGGAVLAPTYLPDFNLDKASLNVAAGFVSASFQYNTVSNASVGVYDGLNGTGMLLYTFVLNANGSDWTRVSQDLGGIGRSIVFGGAGNVDALAVYDNVSVNAVPLPAGVWLLISGIGGLGAMARRRRAA